MYFIFTAVYSINLVLNAINISQYIDISQNFQTIMIDLFTAYRQYILDDSIIFFNKKPFDYL